MSTMLIQSGTLDDIADAIRAKTGKVASMTPLEMPQEIASISGGGEVVVEEIIPRMTSNTTPKGTCSASYVYSGRYAYYGFTTSGNGNVGDATQFWYNNGGTDQWIQYEFEKAVTIFHILFGTVQDGTGKRFKFQFSSDGTNWTDGETITIADNSHTTYDLSTPVYCKYFRIYCIDNIIVISGIRAIGIVGQYNPSSGVTILSGTTEPISSQGTDGQIYLKTVDYGEDLTTFTNHKESSMTINKTSNNIEFIYVSGGTIGADVYKQIDLTDIDEIKVTLTMGNKAYQSDFTNRHIRVYIENTKNPASTWSNAFGLSPDAEVSTANTSQTFTFDVSSYTGNYWIVFGSHGASSNVSSLIIDGNVVEELIANAKLKVNGAWQDLIGSDIDDVNLGN